VGQDTGCLRGLVTIGGLLVLAWFTGISLNTLILIGLGMIAVVRFGSALARALRPKPPMLLRPASARELRGHALRAGGGAYLATGKEGEWIAAPPQSAVPVLAGPRAGKTTCVVIPALLAHPGPAVATSTKPEVLQATLAARRQLGKTWFFDLQGHGAPPGTKPLRWSPVTQAADWQQAQLVADAMTGSAEVDHDAAHWIERAGALIASCLHAAAISHQGMREVLGWALRHDHDAPLSELEPGSLPHDTLSGIKHTAERERASIFSTAARVLRAYRSETALRASEDQNFDPQAFCAPPTPSTSPPPPTNNAYSPPLWSVCSQRYERRSTGSSSHTALRASPCCTCSMSAPTSRRCPICQRCSQRAAAKACTPSPCSRT
jgi:hypothetical protein